MVAHRAGKQSDGGVDDRKRGRFAATWTTAPLLAPMTLRVVVRDHALNQRRQELEIGD